MAGRRRPLREGQPEHHRQQRLQLPVASSPRRSPPCCRRDEPDIFYSYFTDLPQVLLSGQASDITGYVNATTVPTLPDILPGAMKAVTAGKTIYGIPTSNYTQGLIYNRKLFQQAGLNPDQPPATWADGEGRHRHRQAGQRHLRLGDYQRRQQRRLALLLLHRRRRRIDGQRDHGAPDASSTPPRHPDPAGAARHAVSRTTR